MKVITAEALKALRRSRKMTQNDMADHMGVGVETIRSWEQGKRNIPKRLLADPRTKHLAEEV
jgi:DNA-binding transcriptional regulator YiaG